MEGEEIPKLPSPLLFQSGTRDDPLLGETHIQTVSMVTRVETKVPQLSHFLHQSPSPPPPRPLTCMQRVIFCTLSSAVRLRGIGEEGREGELSVSSTSAVTVKVCDVVLVRRSLCDVVTRVSW